MQTFECFREFLFVVDIISSVFLCLFGFSGIVSVVEWVTYYVLALVPFSLITVVLVEFIEELAIWQEVLSVRRDADENLVSTFNEISSVEVQEADEDIGGCQFKTFQIAFLFSLFHLFCDLIHVCHEIRFKLRCYELDFILHFLFDLNFDFFLRSCL